MAILNRFSEMFEEISTWRRDLHAHPELRFEEYRTAAFVASKLKEFGVDEILTGFGGTGVVGVIHGQNNTSGRSIGFRADMDALPIQEVNDCHTHQPYREKCMPVVMTGIPLCC